MKSFPQRALHRNSKCYVNVILSFHECELHFMYSNELFADE